MFTGIVQTVGTVSALESGRLVVQAEISGPSLETGESISIDGCCLTLVGCSGGLNFDLSDETLSRTKAGSYRVGQEVNLERALRAGDSLGGHFVQGHVDEVAELVSVEGPVFQFKTSGTAILVHKGSVCLDGISLTVIEPCDGVFKVSIVPHTHRVTTAVSWAVGSAVNIEFDVLGKYVAAALNLR